jgi:hypothetical protein
VGGQDHREAAGLELFQADEVVQLLHETGESFPPA